jgi:glycine/D-amino acid oxidase-like deaminating enzyme
MSLSVPPPSGAIELDIAIMGGGVAGLWLANRLQQQDYTFAVFERDALGGCQTMASQGMIHGGMKYTLAGALTGASETVADMPRHWRNCLCGDGDVDLRNTRLLSDHFFLWSGDSIAAKLSTFLASKAVQGRAEPVDEIHYPPLLRHADFGGSLYKLEDIVLDVHSLVTNLARNVERHCFSTAEADLQWHKIDGHLSMALSTASGSLLIKAKRFIFCAGQGNGELLSQLGLAQPAMQLRPLQQVMVRHLYPYSFFGHCLGTQTTPRLTISSHRINPTEQVWYLGGALAERGAHMDAEELIASARAELAELMPWVGFRGARWATLPISRAEPLQPNFMRPDNAFVAPAPGMDNLLVAWPTKLTLAPNLANQTLKLLAQAGVTPQATQQSSDQLHAHLPFPPIAQTPWDLAFPPELSPEEAMAQRFTEPEEDQ